jgi:hypothetical protein
MAIAPVRAGTVTLPTDSKALTPAGQQLANAAGAAAKTPMGPERAAAFEKAVLPILLNDAAGILGTSAAKLTPVLTPAVQGSGASDATLGLKKGDKGVSADTDYPPRAANATWSDFAAALGISKGDAAAVTDLNAQIGALPKADGKYAPAFEQLSPELQQLATRVAKSLVGEAVDLTPREQAFKANLVLNNLAWHTTNFERAAGDASRADPLARNNVFNTYSDNLAYAMKRGGLPAVIDMAISDAYNAGKPGVGKAQFPSVKPAAGFDTKAATSSGERERLSGERPTTSAAPIVQKDVFAAPPPTAWIVKRGDEYVRLDKPPEIDTMVFHGKFQKQVIDGGYDMRGEKNSDTIKWVPTGEVTSERYTGAGDPNMTKFSLDSGSFMVKGSGGFYETSRPPPAGTEIFLGTFQKRVIDGGYDMRGEKNSDTIKWLPSPDVTSQKYEGDPKTVETF